MADSKNDQTQPVSDARTTNSDSGVPLQWFREGVAGLISVVILVIAAVMLYGTYNYARQTPDNADPTVAATRKDSYERQKDIMLYALALLGTVTGYYLGRVPAELHAQQAQKSANTAEKEKVATKTKAISALEVAKEAIAKNLSPPISKTLGAESPAPAKDVENLRHARDQIEGTLRELRNGI